MKSPGSTLICCLLALCQVQGLGAQEKAKELDQDEEGIWMIVSTHERFLRTSPLRIKDEKLNAYLSDLACRVSDDNCEEVRVYALLAPGFNAFMMPNGGMFIQSGLLLRMESESELASVIGHEVAHFSQSHSINSIRRWYKTENTFAILGAVVGAAGGIAAAGASSAQAASRSLDLSGTALQMLQTVQIYAAFQLVAFDRDEEAEADELGLLSIANAGFDPRASARVWQNYFAEDAAAEGEGGFSLISTHPSTESRLRDLSNLADSLQSDYDEQHYDSSALFDVVDPHRRLWLEAEAQSLHPAQFEALVKRQRKLGDFTDGYLAYLRANAWERHAKRRHISESEQEKARQSALELYRIGARSESGLPTNAYRDWGHLSKKMGLDAEAKEAFVVYLQLSPDAWDAKFIRKKFGL